MSISMLFLLMAGILTAALAVGCEFDPVDSVGGRRWQLHIFEGRNEVFEVGIKLGFRYTLAIVGYGPLDLV
jgi:hypothetical protein